MGIRNKIMAALTEMSEAECAELYKRLPKRFEKTEKQKNCNHSMRYSMATGGMTCTLCGWLS